jgi:predicted GH43/DUF377 family glycosyl hydrolase
VTITQRLFPYSLTRIGVIMAPREGDELEAEGVLNPASGRGPDGRYYLLPRLVAPGNVSRIGLARIELADGVPRSVVREGVVLAPERDWERGANNAGVEDPRVTFIPALGLHVMTYVAFGPLGPRPAICVSEDLRSWRRLGPVSFDYDDELGIDFSLYLNKDAVFFPEVIRDPDGVESFAVLHRPAWSLEEIRPGEGDRAPSSVSEPRPSIWIAFIPVADVLADLTALTRWRRHRFLAGPEFPFEQVKIGSGPAPLRVPEGWLLLHHGVTGRLENSIAQQQHVNYAAGAMILDADQPWRVLRRTETPLMVAATEDEQSGTVPNVVFPTAIERIDGRYYVFYGMADSKIGVALLERDPEASDGE